MDNLTALIVAALIATVAVLLAGIYSMAKGGLYDREHAEQFMFFRVTLQAIAVMLIVVAVLTATTSD